MCISSWYLDKIKYGIFSTTFYKKNTLKDFGGMFKKKIPGQRVLQCLWVRYQLYGACVTMIFTQKLPTVMFSTIFFDTTPSPLFKNRWGTTEVATNLALLHRQEINESKTWKIKCSHSIVYIDSWTKNSYACPWRM